MAASLLTGWEGVLMMYHLHMRYLNVIRALISLVNGVCREFAAGRQPAYPLWQLMYPPGGYMVGEYLRSVTTNCELRLNHHVKPLSSAISNQQEFTNLFYEPSVSRSSWCGLDDLRACTKQHSLKCSHRRLVKSIKLIRFASTLQWYVCKAVVLVRAGLHAHCTCKATGWLQADHATGVLPA